MRNLCFVLMVVAVQVTFGQIRAPIPAGSCTDPGVCWFTGTATDKVHLTRCDGVCTCEPSKDEYNSPTWKLEWGSQGCQIAPTGPCGQSSDGLKLVCHDGQECLEGRCRDPNHLREGSMHNGCYDDIDCKEGLVCKFISLYGDPWKACVKPGTPEFKG